MFADAGEICQAQTIPEVRRRIHKAGVGLHELEG